MQIQKTQNAKHKIQNIYTYTCTCTCTCKYTYTQRHILNINQSVSWTIRRLHARAVGQFGWPVQTLFLPNSPIPQSYNLRLCGRAYLYISITCLDALLCTLFYLPTSYKQTLQFSKLHIKYYAILLPVQCNIIRQLHNLNEVQYGPKNSATLLTLILLILLLFLSFVYLFLLLCNFILFYVLCFMFLIKCHWRLQSHQHEYQQDAHTIYAQSPAENTLTYIEKKSAYKKYINGNTTNCLIAQIHSNYCS